MENSIKKTKPLKIGCTIGIALPAAPVNKELLELFKRELTNLGYLVKFSENSNSSYGYLAGNDQERAKAFMNLWLDPEVDVVWCARGGYGCSRLLPLLDFKLLKKHPKMFIGMSDITAIHMAMSHISLVTYLGPTLSCLFSLEKQKNTFTHEHCWNYLSKPTLSYTYSQEYEVIKEGSGQGKLVGGNLSLINSLIGTPWQIETKGKILILEDVNEAPYRIDRMLNQLQQAGLLDHLQGIILGTFKDCLSREPNKSLSLSQIFKEYFSYRTYPSILGFPTGHSESQVTIPLSIMASLETSSKTIKLLESAMTC